MKQFRGLWFPDYEKHFIEIMEATDNIEFAGAGVYQLRKFAKAFPLIRDFRHAVDVGAHVGSWSRVLARCFSSVTAFEPISLHRDCFKKNINSGDRRNVTLHPCALGEVPGEVGFCSRVDSSGWCHIAADGETPDEVAEVRTLDSFDLPKVDFMKIDCEGFEYFVLKGAVQTIMRDRPVIIVEQKPNNGSRYGLKDDRAVTFLQKCGAKVEFEWSGDYCMRWEK